MINFNLNNETDQLDMVILGIGTDQGTREKSINPKANKHLEEGTFPIEEDVLAEIAEFEQILIRNRVKVFRPQNLNNKQQIFTRDIGFVIGDIFFESRMSPERGQEEINEIRYILELIGGRVEPWGNMPSDATIEGGDVMLFGDKVFIGKSDRTNDVAFKYLKDKFEKKLNKEFIQIEVNTSKRNADEYVLHLDCAFQPIGKNSAILYEDGIINASVLKKQLSKVNLITVSQKQAYRMFPNIFSISPSLIVIEKRFFELKHKLLDLNKQGLENFRILEANYFETSKLSGLLRCSTLPLTRIN